jgi:hypothetical protein
MTRQTTGDMSTREIMVREVVYDAALLRAKAQAQQLRAVAREILFDRAARAKAVPHATHPAARVMAWSPRTRLRFRVSAKAYDKAKAKLHSAGTSVTAAIEEGLEQYARTGQFK